VGLFVLEDRFEEFSRSAVTDFLGYLNAGAVTADRLVLRFPVLLVNVLDVVPNLEAPSWLAMDHPSRKDV
jgi:hypothetical protein